MHVLINFSHPLSGGQKDQIATLTGFEVGRDGWEVREVKTQIDFAADFEPQIDKLIKAVGLSPKEWSGVFLLVILPGHSAVAAGLLAKIHGLCGHFPDIALIRPVVGSSPPAFEVGGIVSLLAYQTSGVNLWRGGQ